MFDWNDLRYFLATARSGSTVAASRLLHVDQSTVSRRIAALEQSLGAKLFDKTVAGYRLTDIGRELIPAAERAELEAGSIMLMVEERARQIAGTLRVTTNETIADLFLMPSLAEFAELYPDIRVDVIVSARWLDLERGEADVALRAARHLEEAGRLATQLAELPWAIYCSRQYAECHGRADSAGELSLHKVIGVDGPLSAVAGFDWLEKRAGEEAVIARTNSLPNLLTAVRAGLGISALPCVLGEGDAGLIRCIGPSPDLCSFIWFLTGPQVRREPRVRAFGSFIAAKAPMLRQLLGFTNRERAGSSPA